MASFSFTNQAFRLSFSPGESRALRRPNLSLDKIRIISAQMAALPSKADLGHRVSKKMLFNSIVGEYRTSSQKVLVLGKLKGSSECLKITISHPGIDHIWVCGSQASELESKLTEFIGLKQ